MILFRPDIFILLWKFRNFEENTYENHSRHHYRAGFFHRRYGQQNGLEDEDDENAVEEELTETYDGETDETEKNPRRKFVKTIIITNKND